MAQRAATIARITAQFLLLASFAGTIATYAQKTYRSVFEDPKSKLPKLTYQPKTWKWFRDAFEPAFNERVAWRHLFVRRYARFKINQLGVSSTPRVWLGADGWLFYNHEAEPEHYFSPGTDQLADRLGEWERAMPEWREWLERRNIRFVIVVAPNKQSVHDEYLPEVERKKVGPRPLDQLIATWHAADSRLEVLDLRPALREERHRERMYFRLDTHWLLQGAYVGYRETARWVGWAPIGREGFIEGSGGKKHNPDCLNFLGYTPADLVFETTTDESGDTIYIEPFTHMELRQPKARPAPVEAEGDQRTQLQYLKSAAWEQANAELPRVVLFHDSFGDGFYAGLLAEHCSRLLAVPSNHLDPRVIEREKPSVVVLEIVERLFQGIGARRPSDPPRESKSH